MNLCLTPTVPMIKRRTLEDIPERIRLGWALRLFSLGSLVWDYADTVLNYAVLMRRHETKKLCRAVRAVKDEYDRFRARSIDDSYVRREAAIGLDMEELFQDHLQKLHYGLRNEISRYKLKPNSAAMVEAAQQCLTLIDTMRLYASDCDRQIGQTGSHSILPGHFDRLAGLITEFAGDAYDRNSQTRTLTAKILYNELKNLVMRDDNGKL